MTRTMGDPIHLAWRLDDRVQLLTVPGHFRWPVLMRPQLAAFELTPRSNALFFAGR